MCTTISSQSRAHRSIPARGEPAVPVSQDLSVERLPDRAETVARLEHFLGSLWTIGAALVFLLIALLITRVPERLA